MEAFNYIVTSEPDVLMQSGWKEFVLSHEHGNFFQLPETFTLFQKVPGYTPVVAGLIHKESNKVCGILQGVIQRENTFYGRLTARFIVWGGPLTATTAQAELLLLHLNKMISGKVIYTQFRNLFDCSSLLPAFDNCGFTFNEHLNYLVNTRVESAEKLLAAVSKSKSRQIKKGLSSCSIIEATHPHEADAFYYLLKDLYTEKVNKPLPPKIFFDYFFENIIHQGLGKLLLIKHEEKIIGGIMCPITPGKAIYEWYIAGLDKEFKEHYPSILATWAAIEEGRKIHLKHFDFLGAGKPDADYGVREFKSKFGGTLVNFGRFEKVYQPLLMKAGTIGLKIYKYLRR